MMTVRSHVKVRRLGRSLVKNLPPGSGTLVLARVFPALGASAVMSE